MATGGAWLEVSDLCVTLHTPEGDVPAVRDVSLSIGHGEVLGLVGESGSGKSALATSLMALHPLHTATVTARVWQLGDWDLRCIPERLWQPLRGHKLAMVFQDPMTALNPYKTVGAQLDEVLRLHTALGAQTRRARCLDMVGQVGLADGEGLFNRYPHALSGGMRQRVLIAMALLAGPELLIADEPTTALDVTVQAQILALMRLLGRQRHMAMLLISHDLGVLCGIADRIGVMYAGQIVEMRDCDGLFAAPRHPYTAALLAAMPDSPGAKTPPQPIPGTPPDLRALPLGCAFAPRCPRAQPLCRAESPPLVTLAHGGSLRCFNPLPTPEAT